MPLIYVTGPTAAGKSTVRNELVRRGYEAHDADADGLTSWYDSRTGQPVAYPEDVERPQDWLVSGLYVFELSRERVERLAERAEHQVVFLCGIARNDLELAHLFSRVVCLTLDEETLRYRVATRTTNTFGKASDELAHVLRHHKPAQEWYRKFGAMMVDAVQPLDVVVDDIVAIGESAFR
jgi:adenylate kinase family enzyme